MEQKTEASQAVDERQLLDEDGENRAVRTFLMQYGVPSLTIGAMCQHMERSGWGHEYWPPFAKRHPAPRAEHLTKAGAQIWIRYLIDLERAALKAQPAPTEAQGAQLSGNSGELQPSGNTGELAPGEDSARLDAEDLATIEEATKVLESAAKHNSLMGRTVFADVQRNRADRLRAIIDRARVSAETSGVNAQPPYPEGDVVGACVCGSWPGGKCLKCPWIAAPQPQEKSCP